MCFLHSSFNTSGVNHPQTSFLDCTKLSMRNFSFKTRTTPFLLVDMTAKDFLKEEIRKSGSEFENCGGSRWLCEFVKNDQSMAAQSSM